MTRLLLHSATALVLSIAAGGIGSAHAAAPKQASHLQPIREPAHVAPPIPRVQQVRRQDVIAIARARWLIAEERRIRIARALAAQHDDHIVRVEPGALIRHDHGTEH
jgi:hypothetical protein